MSAQRDGAPSRRIDKWLWCARRFKTRSLAARFISEASVRVTRDGSTQRIDRPAFCLREGDEVSFMLGERLFVLTVLAFSDRRGDSAAARALFAEKDAARDLPSAAGGGACKAAR